MRRGLVTGAGLVEIDNLIRSGHQGDSVLRSTSDFWGSGSVETRF
jgi:hypothetical protein